MADTIAKLNQVKTWVSTGTGDTITCYDISSEIRNGVQIDTTGFDVDTATITVTTKGGAVKVANAPASSGQACLTGDKWSMSTISLSGIAAGTYTVRFGQ